MSVDFSFLSNLMMFFLVVDLEVVDLEIEREEDYFFFFSRFSSSLFVPYRRDGRFYLPREKEVCRARGRGGEGGVRESSG